MDAPIVYTEQYLLERHFKPPIMILTYAGLRRIEVKKLDTFEIYPAVGARIPKLHIMFAFPEHALETLRGRITVDERIKARELQPIQPVENRPPIIGGDKLTAANNGKFVKLTMRTGHIIRGKQLDLTLYTIFIACENEIILVYRHGVFQYTIELDDQPLQS